MKLKAALVSVLIGLTISTPSVRANEPVQNATITSGVYFNTPGSRTTFENTGGNSSLWLHSGSNVPGVESSGALSNPASSCGAMNIQVPPPVVHMDGKIEVSALNTVNAYLGNGGKIYTTGGVNMGKNGRLYVMGVSGNTTIQQANTAATGVINIESSLLHPQSEQSANRLEVQGGTFKIINTSP